MKQFEMRHLIKICASNYNRIMKMAYCLTITEILLDSLIDLLILAQICYPVRELLHKNEKY